MRKIAIGQAGGPTAVINTSLAGFLDTVQADVYGVLDGFQGLVEGNIVKITEDIKRKVDQHRDVPGACLGAGRYQMSDDQKVKALRQLQERDIHTLVFIGGDGTMSALCQLSQTAHYIGYELQVVGIPKTVDNDLAETDHSPGFASAARYVALAVRDISKDLEAMRNFEQVRIIETMGRNVGWLAAASGLLKNHETDGPHAIYFPEQVLTAENFLKNTNDLVQKFGFVSIVVSEGVTIQERPSVEKAIVNGRKVLGGVSTQLAQLVHDELGLMARDELLGMNQRASQLASSSQDRREAYDVGKKAALLVEEGISKVMVAINRTSQTDYQYRLSAVSLEKVVGGAERHLPNHYIKDLDQYYQWLRPLVGFDL
ncbi:MAG TPA: diphosphate--fructose-6-phosphate 1-phosphotransferase, partial [Bacillales bacterium]